MRSGFRLGQRGNTDWSAIYLVKNGTPTRLQEAMDALDDTPLERIPGRDPNMLISRLAPGVRIEPHAVYLNTQLTRHVAIIPAGAGWATRFANSWCSATRLTMRPGTRVIATVLASAHDHYELRHEAHSSLSPDALWDHLTWPEEWWHPDHTYSGDARNLSLDAGAGGLWREDRDGGSFARGSVLLVREGEQIRLDAPLGPLQALG